MTNTLLIIFIAIAAAALAGQFLILLGVGRKLEETLDKITPLLPQFQDSVRSLPALVKEAQQMVAETRPPLQAFSTSVAEIGVIARDQVRRADAFVTEVSERLELQLVRVDEALGATLANVEQITATVRDTVLKPVNDFSALFEGVRTGLDFFFKRRASPALNPRPSSTYQDEEMFI